MRSIRVTAGVLTVFVVSALLGIAPADADGGGNDSTPPVMESLALSPETIDTSASARVINVTARVTDDISGVNAGCCSGGNIGVNFRSPSGQQSAYASFSQRSSGTALDGTYTGTMTVNRYAETGTWTVSSISLSDAAGNYRSMYDPATIQAAGLDRTFEQTGPGDAAAPVMESLVLSPETIDTSASARVINVTARVTDDISGVNAGCCSGGNIGVNFRSPSGQQSAYASFSQRSSGTALDGTYTGTMTVNRYAETGTWTVSSISLSDAAGNYRSMYDPATIQAAGLDRTFEVADLSAFLPGAPTGVTASPADTQATVAWSSPESDGGFAIESYKVTVYSGASVVKTVNASGAPATITGLTNGVAYTFTVSATNAAGTGAPSAPSAAVTPAPPSLLLTQTGSSAPVGTFHTVTATVRDSAGALVPDGTAVRFTVVGTDGQTGSRIVGESTLASLAVQPSGQGYWAAGRDGAVFPFGTATAQSPAEGQPAVTGTVIDAVSTPTGSGYLLATAEGSVFAFGDAVDRGEPGTAGQVGIELTPTGAGYWIVDGQGRVAVYGDAKQYGNVQPSQLTAGEKVVGFDATPSGKGYWMATTAGRVVPFGDAGFLGHTAEIRLNQPIVTMASTPTGNGYYLLAKDGGVFSFGDASFFGSTGNLRLDRPMVEMTVTRSGRGYWLANEDGRIFPFGDAANLGSAFTPLTTGGVATFRFSSTATGTTTVTASPASGSVTSNSLTQTWTSGAPAGISLYGPTSPPVSAPTGTARTFTARVTDAYGNPAPDGTTVTFNASGTGGESPASGTAGTVSGNAEFTFTSSTGGTSTVTASAGALSASSTITWIQAPVVTAPAAPTSVSAVGLFSTDRAIGVAAISWVAGADGGSAITSYKVTANPGGQTATVAAPGTSTVISNLQNGVSYTFTVQAQNSVGLGAPATTATAVPYSYPAPVPGVSAEQSGATAIVQWETPTDDGGRPITGYEVTAEPVSGAAGSYEAAGLRTASGVKVTASAGARSATITGLTPGARYEFKVSALNAGGASPVGDVSTAIGTIVVTRSGYWMVESNGTVYAFGNAAHLGNANVGTAEAVDLEPTPSGNGYWVVDKLGRVYAFGDAVARGSAAGLKAGERVTSLSATSSGAGYWLFTNRGRVLTFGNAVHHGDMASVSLNGEVLDSMPTPSGNGYYMVAADGGIFSFGDAEFYGSMGGIKLNAAVQSLVPTSSGRGYWLVASDGGIFAFGDAGFAGSMGATKLNRPVTGMVRFGDAYLMVGEDGGIFNFSNRQFFGSLGATPPARPIVAVAALEV